MCIANRQSNKLECIRGPPTQTKYNVKRDTFIQFDPRGVNDIDLCAVFLT